MLDAWSYAAALWGLLVLGWRWTMLTAVGAEITMGEVDLSALTLPDWLCDSHPALRLCL
jgi:hypothetical protein